MEEDTFDDVQERKISQFNSGIAILYRIDALWQATHRYSLSSDFINWNFCLDRLWRELNSDCDEEQIEMFNRINNLLDKNYLLYKQNEVSKKEIYDLLNLKEDFIRKMQQIQGKGTQYKESAEDYFD